MKSTWHVALVQGHHDVLLDGWILPVCSFDLLCNLLCILGICSDQVDHVAHPKVAQGVSREI